MTLRSMTGFGSGSASRAGLRIEIEAASVNGKSFNIRTALPRAMAGLEPKIDAAVHERVARGNVSINVQLHLTDAARRRISVDKVMAAEIVCRLREVGRELGLADTLSLSDLARLPEVVRLDNQAGDTETLWPVAQRALKAALKEFDTMRLAEGRALARDIGARITALRALRARLAAIAPRVPRDYAAVLRKRIEAMGVELAAGDAALHREIALFADRCDVSEELTRIESHLEQGARILKEGGVCGRALEFVCQELFREINTTGSKANDAEMSALIIEFKSELERIREQVQNIE